jgi:hypothetical protein
LRNYRRLLVEAGRIREAEPIIAEAESLYASSFPPTDPQRLGFDVVRAQLLLARGNRDEAHTILENVTATARAGDPRTAPTAELLREQFGQDGG